MRSQIVLVRAVEKNFDYLEAVTSPRCVHSVAVFTARVARTDVCFVDAGKVRKFGSVPSISLCWLLLSQTQPCPNLDLLACAKCAYAVSARWWSLLQHHYTIHHTLSVCQPSAQGGMHR